MDYVCTVVGNLYIKDLHLDLSYMEIIDLSSDDFKSTPQLRDCLRSRQLEIYLPNKYPLAKKFRNRNSIIKPIELPKEVKNSSNEDFSNISKNLNDVSERLSNSLSKIDSLIDSFQGYTLSPRSADNPEVNNLILKMDKLIDAIENSRDSAKFDILINKFDNLLSKNSSAGFIMSSGSNVVEKSKTYTMDTPIYVPELSLSDVGKKNIKAQEVSSEGTDDILEKLKLLKNK